MRQQLQSILDQALDAMCREIDPDHGLLRKLQSERVLSSDQIDSCKAKATRADKIEEMVRFLKLREDSAYDKFRQILGQVDQQQFVDNHLPSADRDPKESTLNPQHHNITTADVQSQSQSQTQKMAQQLPGSTTEALAVNQPTERTPTRPMNTNGTTNVEDDDADVIDVKVLHTTEQFYRNHYESAYPVYRRCRGTACIINIFRAFGMSDRRGTDTDRDRLVELFQQLHFNVKVYNDSDGLTAEDILKKIEETSKEKTDGKWPQCYVLFILTHGGKLEIDGHETEVVFGTDGKPLSKKRIMSVLSDASCSNLQRVPRLIFFQSCRGETLGLSEETDRVEARQVQGDFLVCHPCQQDFVSYRNPAHGTRYIRCLVDLFMNNAHDTHVLDLLTLLHQKLESLVVADKRHQVPELTSSLRKKFFFFPGYFE